MALHSQVQLCYVEMEVEHRQSCAGEREEGGRASSQQSHICQVGWGYKPRGEGGSEGPCVPLLSQGAQGLCVMLLSVQRQLAAGRGSVWLEPGHLSP